MSVLFMPLFIILLAITPARAVSIKVVLVVIVLIVAVSIGLMPLPLDNKGFSALDSGFNIQVLK
jgi:hypothetical protein